jgi:hypothetical protein
MVCRRDGDATSGSDAHEVAGAQARVAFVVHDEHRSRDSVEQLDHQRAKSDDLVCAAQNDGNWAVALAEQFGQDTARRA